MVQKLIAEGATDYNSAMAFAAHLGHLDIVKLMLRLGATAYNRAIDVASYVGHRNIADYIKQYRLEHSG
jgi:ankyrin repeat protein